jgi:hypothetical protein
MMGRRWTEEDYDRTTRQIEEWIAAAHRMWLDAYETILRVRRIQDKLIEQSQPLRNPGVSPWMEWS